MDRLRALRVIEAQTDLSLYSALRLADALHAEFAPKRKGAVDLTSFEGRREFARGVPGVLDLIADGKVIQAIKEVRTASHLSLKEAKDAVDALRGMHADRVF